MSEVPEVTLEVGAAIQLLQCLGFQVSKKKVRLSVVKLTSTEVVIQLSGIDQPYRLREGDTLIVKNNMTVNFED